MATSTQNTPPQPIQHPGLIISTISLVLRIVGLLIASLLLSILIEFAGLLLFWGDQGWRHSQAMLTSELGWLSESFKSSLLIQRTRSINPAYPKVGQRSTVASAASSSTATELRSPLPTKHGATAPVCGAATYRAPGR